MNSDEKFDKLMSDWAENDNPAPVCPVNWSRVWSSVEARRPLIWRNCAIVSSTLAAAATIILAFSLGFNAPVDNSADAVDEVYQTCESTFALYSYNDR